MYDLTKKSEIRKLQTYLLSYFKNKLFGNMQIEDAIQDCFVELIALQKNIITFDDIRRVQSKIKKRVKSFAKKSHLTPDGELDFTESIKTKTSGSLVVNCAVCQKQTKKFLSKIKKSVQLFCSNQCRSQFYSDIKKGSK